MAATRTCRLFLVIYGSHQAVAAIEEGQRFDREGGDLVDHPRHGLVGGQKRVFRLEIDSRFWGGRQRWNLVRPHRSGRRRVKRRQIGRASSRQECGSPCRSRWSQDHYKKKK